MDAFFFIDKPTGITSFQVLREMRKILWMKKIGHTGTLDPLATGGLLVATGNYTKLIPYLEKDTKTYEATIMLDGTSVSYDRDTQINFFSPEEQSKAKRTISKKDIERILWENFSGSIQQIPPKYSALKIEGEKALERVKSGEELTMKPREVEIISSNITLFEYPKLVVEFEVSAGTYIRSIAHDLWEILQTWGYIYDLRRTKIGSLDISLSTPLDNLDISKKLGVEELFSRRICVFQDETVYKRLSDGQRVRGDFPFWENYDIFLSDGENIRYVIEYKNNVIHPRKKIT